MKILDFVFFLMKIEFTPKIKILNGWFRSAILVHSLPKHGGLKSHKEEDLINNHYSPIKNKANQ